MSSGRPEHDDWDAIYDLLREKLRVSGECWEWTGYQMPSGHGQLRRRGMPSAKLVHRYVWSHIVGDIGGWCVLHHCDNPPCVRPTHLWLGTQGDNNRDRDAKGRGTPPPVNWDGIHCRRGHIIADNPYFDPTTGVRRCKRCMNAKSRKWMLKNKGIGRGA